MRLATTIADFRDYVDYGNSPAEAVRLFEGTGFRYLDYNFYNVIYPNSPFLGDKWMDQVVEAAEAADKLGMKFVQAHSPDYNPLNPKHDREAGMLATIRSIEACGYLGVENLVVHPGFSAQYSYPQDREAYFAINREYYRSLIPAMEKHNVNVLIENSAEANTGGAYYFMTGQEMAEFLDEMDHPKFYAVWDTGHANLRNTSQYKDICDLGPYLKALHIQDNFGAKDEHFAPLMGTTDMDAVMQGLKKVGYDGYFTFEATKFPLYKARWPHARKVTPDLPEDRRLAGPDIELRREAETFLYKIGKFILSQYDCFEE